MASKHLMIAVNWYGPYTGELADIRATATQQECGHGLYVGIGKLAYQRVSHIQYIGIANLLGTRLNDTHHALPKISRDREIWLGDIATAEPSGKKQNFTKTTLDNAEWLHARFMQLPLNSKKTIGLPKRSVTVLNRWWKTDCVTMRSNRPHPDWPNLIDFPGEGLAAHMVWFGGKQSHFNGPDY